MTIDRLVGGRSERLQITPRAAEFLSGTVYHGHSGARASPASPETMNIGH